MIPIARRALTMAQQQISLDRATVAKLKLDAGKTDQIFFDADLR